MSTGRWLAERETGSMLGSILVAAGMVRRIDLYRVLSEMWGCSFVDLTDDPIDPALLKDVDPRRLVAELWFPVRVEPDGRIVVATALRPDAGTAADDRSHPRRTGRPGRDERVGHPPGRRPVLRRRDARRGRPRPVAPRPRPLRLPGAEPVAADRHRRDPGRARRRARPGADRHRGRPLGHRRRRLPRLGRLQVRHVHGRLALRSRRVGHAGGDRRARRHRAAALHDPRAGVPRGQRRRRC